MMFPNRLDTYRAEAVQASKQARNLKFWLYEEEGLHYLSSENKGADQLRGYREADLHLCFRICRLLVSDAAAHILIHLPGVCVGDTYLVCV